MPHSDLPLEELERVRNTRREDMEFTNENGYSDLIDEIPNGDVNVVYTATGWPAHTAFIDLRTEAFKASTIGLRDIMHAKMRYVVHNFVNPDGSSWQRMVSRLELYGPITQAFSASILRLGKGICYVSEAIAKPFASLEKRYV